MSETSFFSALWNEMKRPPFLVLVVFFFLCMTSEGWLMWDGCQFHFNNYFLGIFSNNRDITRLLSAVFSEIWSVSYFSFGGTSFLVSKALFQFGHVYHIFLPFLLLVYLKYKEPELNKWADRSLMFYLFSLMVYTGFSYLFYVSEMKMAHTLTWSAIFCFRSQSESAGNMEFKQNYMWTLSILALFTYPLTLFTNLFLLLSQQYQITLGKYKFGPLKDRASDHRKDFRLFFLAMILAGLGLLFIYNVTWQGLEEFHNYLQLLPRNSTAKFLFFALIFLFACKPLFRGYFIILAPAIFFAFYFSNTADPWHYYNGRFLGVVSVILIQFSYIFIGPLFDQYKLDLGFQKRTYAYAAFILALMFYQDIELRRYHSYLVNMMNKEKQVVTYEEAISKLQGPARSVVSEYFVRQKSISLLLMTGAKDINSYIDKKSTVTIKDFFDFENDQSLTQRLAKKNLTMSAPLIRNQ